MTVLVSMMRLSRSSSDCTSTEVFLTSGPTKSCAESKTSFLWSAQRRLRSSRRPVSAWSSVDLAKSLETQ